MHGHIEQLKPGPFSLVVEGGLPSDPTEWRDSLTKHLRRKVRSSIDARYSTVVIGALSGLLSTGRNTYLPEAKGAVEPIAEHGATFLNPEIFLTYPSSGQLVCMQAMKELIISVASPNQDIVF